MNRELRLCNILLLMFVLVLSPPALAQDPTDTASPEPAVTGTPALLETETPESVEPINATPEPASIEPIKETPEPASIEPTKATPEPASIEPIKATPESTTPEVPAILNFPFHAPPKDESKAEIRGPLSGKLLLTIRSAQGYSAQSRADAITERLQKITTKQGATTSIITYKQYNGVIVLTTADTVLATVMPEDSGLLHPRSLPASELKSMQLGIAEIWRLSLQEELAHSAWLHSSDYLRFVLPFIGLVLLLGAILHKGLQWAHIRNPGFSVWGMMLLMWALVVTLLFWMFPLTKPVAFVMKNSFLWPFIKLCVLATVVNIMAILVERIVRVYFAALIDEPGIRPRRAQRLQTFCSVLCTTMKAILAVIMGGLAISFLPFNLWPLITSAGVFGLAIGLAGQDFLKDIIAGILILMEDRFGVGDWIEWGSHSGLVESITLRATRIRTIEGGLVTLPNSDLRVVNNLSNEWAQVDFRVSIAYNADLELALKALEEEANRLAEEWNDKIVEAPELKGVQELGDSGIELRIYLKTAPLEQWDVRRELNHRVKLRLDREGIEIPFPQTALWLRGGAAEKINVASAPEEKQVAEAEI